MYKSKIIREKSLLDTSSELENLHIFSNVPASMACTTQNIEEDIHMNQVWDICKNTGLIQLRELFPLELVYKFPHNDGVGKVWENHDKVLVDFMSKLPIKNILEIGAGMGRLGKLFLSKFTDGRWTGLEPNYNYDTINISNFIHKREWFDSDYIIVEKYDAIIHSHVLEHTYNPVSFLKTIHNQIDDDTLHIFSIPDLFHSLEKKFTNQLNFEHTIFLTEDIVDILLSQIGFRVVKKHFYEELPCLFYLCEKVESKKVFWSKSIYKKNKKVFLDFVEFYTKEVKELNKKIDEFDGEVFLFGAHIFSQFLIFNGLNIARIVGILDNSLMKQGNRLYGTSFMVKSPKILKDYDKVAVIVKTAAYTKEIKQDIINNINDKIIFFD